MITLDIKLMNGTRIATAYDFDHDARLKEIMALEETEIQSIIGNLENVHYNMDFVNKVVCISTENHIELTAMSELKNLKEVVLIGFYEEYLSSDIYEDLWDKAYVNEQLNKYILP
jgi:hypothetical protein